MATLTLGQRLAAAAEIYKSGQTATRPALAEVKRLARLKVAQDEVTRQLAINPQGSGPDGNL